MSHTGDNPHQNRQRRPMQQRESPQDLGGIGEGASARVFLHWYTSEKFGGTGSRIFHLHDLLPPAVDARRCHVDGEDQPQVDDPGGRFDAFAPHVGQKALQRQTCAREQPTPRSRLPPHGGNRWRQPPPSAIPTPPSPCHHPVPSSAPFAGTDLC